LGNAGTDASTVGNCHTFPLPSNFKASNEDVVAKDLGTTTDKPSGGISVLQAGKCYSFKSTGCLFSTGNHSMPSLLRVYPVMFPWLQPNIKLVVQDFPPLGTNTNRKLETLCGKARLIEGHC
jgi:hypothetical protein